MPVAGSLVLFGSGETSSSGRAVYDLVFSRMGSPIRLSILETPAGFQPNSFLVARKIADFIEDRLRNYHPSVSVVSARARGAHLGTDDPGLLEPLLRSNAVFLGPGSPTYAVRHLTGSRALHYMRARHRQGAALIFASAAAIACGRWCLPVYEIYKAGADLYWEDGLDLLAPFGISTTIIPHWNNTEGGAELDTSRCFMGRDRFDRLLAMLPDRCTVLGIEEHTALLIDLAAGVCTVMGKGGVEILCGDDKARHEAGTEFSASDLGQISAPEPSEGIPEEIWREVVAGGPVPGQETGMEREEPIPERVRGLVARREEARARQEWVVADRLREQIADEGWQIQDTADGPVLERQED